MLDFSLLENSSPLERFPARVKNGTEGEICVNSVFRMEIFGFGGRS
jgi:hypothetical protein